MKDYSYFKFSIKNDKYQVYKKFGAFIFCLNALAFLYLANTGVSKFSSILFISTAVLLLGSALYYFMSRRHDRSYIPLYIIASFVWITETGFYLAAIVLIILMILQILAQHKIYLEIDKNEIRLKNYSVKSFDWDSVENMVMKDGLLSIDLTSQKILQVEPDLLEPVIVHRGGSLNPIPWTISEDYDELESAVNNFYQERKRLRF